jgi:hypothetical protein
MKHLNTVVAAAALAAITVAPVSLAHEDARDAYFAKLSALCGASFEGTSVFPTNMPADDPFAGKTLYAHVVSCNADEIRVPFIVGEDRSRTWVISRSADGLQLKHDHRHEDGSPDEVTMYGGMASATGSAHVQAFFADAHTAKLIPAAATNVWTLSLSPDGTKMTYFLERDGKPRFKAELARKK